MPLQRPYPSWHMAYTALWYDSSLPSNRFRAKTGRGKIRSSLEGETMRLSPAFSPRSKIQPQRQGLAAVLLEPPWYDLVFRFRAHGQQRLVVKDPL